MENTGDLVYREHLFLNLFKFLSLDFLERCYLKMIKKIINQ